MFVSYNHAIKISDYLKFVKMGEINFLITSCDKSMFDIFSKKAYSTFIVIAWKFRIMNNK